MVAVLGAGTLTFFVGRTYLVREISTEVQIEASPEQVWDELSSFRSYEEWNPYIQEARGRAVVGGDLEVRIQAPNSRERTFRPEVLVAEPGRELRWSGSLPVPGSFNGEHYFLIEPSGEDRVRFVQGEEFTGLLVPFLWKGLDTDTRLGFEKMNRALKERVEGSVPEDKEN
jgi:hypothetical protein